MFDFLNNYLIDGTIIFVLILILTFLQKYYYKILFYLKRYKFLKHTVSFIIRTWVIIHEFAHVFFAFLSWAKIQEIKLFEKTWWYVKYSYKNYIQAMAEGMNSFSYWILLILNQIWIFLTSLWPLILWIWLNYIFWYYLIWLDLQNFQDFNNILEYIWYLDIVYLFVYILIIPSFVLSWKDISHFIVSKQNNIIATFIWSFINIFIFILFMMLFSLTLHYFILFVIWFLLSFSILLIVLMFYIFFNKKNNLY